MTSLNTIQCLKKNFTTHLCPLLKVNLTYMMHKVWPHQPCWTSESCWLSALLTQCRCCTVQTGTGKVDPTRKLKCTTAARVMFYFSLNLDSKTYLFIIFQHTDSAGWTITPYCTATAKHPNFGLIDLGTYSSGNILIWALTLLVIYWSGHLLFW